MSPNLPSEAAVGDGRLTRSDPVCPVKEDAENSEMTAESVTAIARCMGTGPGRRTSEFYSFMFRF